MGCGRDWGMGMLILWGWGNGAEVGILILWELGQRFRDV